MASLLTDEILDLMRKIGDPRVDKALALPRNEGKCKQLFTSVLGKEKDAGFTWFLDGNRLETNAPTFNLSDFLKDPGTLPDPDLVETACDLFARYGSEIAAALLLAALPEAYAAGEGANVLAQHSQLIKGGTLSTRRILATAQFVIWVLTPGPPDPAISRDMSKYSYPSYQDTSALWGARKGQALRACLALRMMHGLIRVSPARGIKGPALDRPKLPLLNQEDLLATLLSFSITVFEVLEQFGISWTAEEQEAYFYVWDCVGRTLGIADESVILQLTRRGSLADLTLRLRNCDEGDFRTGRVGVAGKPPGSRVTLADTDKLFAGPINRRVLRRAAEAGTLRPQSVPEARELLARLRERMWTLESDSFPQRQAFDYENFKRILDDVGPGRMLLKSMVDEVAAQLPASQKTWPIAVIRQLVPSQVQNRLALGGTSSIGFLSGIVGSQRDSPGSVVLRRITAAVLRQRATRVADSLFLYYYDQGDLTIPGLRSTSLGYGMPRVGPLVP